MPDPPVDHHARHAQGDVGLPTVDIVMQQQYQVSPERVWSHTGGPMPLPDLLAEIRVSDLGSGASEIVWPARLEPAGLPAADAEALVCGGPDNPTALAGTAAR